MSATPASAVHETLFLNARDVRITAKFLQFGQGLVSLDTISAYRVDVKCEEGPRLGNIIMTNLFVAATLAFLIGIHTEYLTSRFYLAVGLFGLLSAAAIDDLVRSRGLTLYRLLLQSPTGEKLAYITPNASQMQAVTAALDRVFAAEA